MNFCIFRAKLVISGRIPHSPPGRTSKARITGIEMHQRLAAPYESFSRRILLSALGHNNSRVYSRELDGTLITGRFDNLSVKTVEREGERIEEVTFFEYKTTSKKRFFRFERELAKFQLRIYLWLMEPYLREQGKFLAKKHYVEIYSQKAWLSQRRLKCLYKDEVIYDPNFENILRKYLMKLKGLDASPPPEGWKCKFCPRSVKAKCPLRHGGFP